ncbi:MAG: formate/nitrite transporter family protein [Pseudomonadota bacterium]
MEPPREDRPQSLDAYAPREIAARVASAGVAKAATPLGPLLTLAVLAGAFIAFGGAYYTAVLTGAEPVTGADRMLAALGFCLGLQLVVVGGAELFTGNALMVMALVDRRIEPAALLRNWSVVFAGNGAGALAVAAAMAAAGLLDGPTGAVAAGIAEAKASLPAGEAFFRGVLCNALVCLAVWLAMSARSATGKAVVILLPVSAFVALGFEHSVANLYLIPAGILAGAEPAAGDVLRNLVFVTLGNIVGGGGGVALAYRFAYGGR